MADPHLSHAIPWNLLNEALVFVELQGSGGKKDLMLRVERLPQAGKAKHPNSKPGGPDTDDGEAAWKTIQHFGRCVSAKVKEFRETDKWRDLEGVADPEAERQKYDPGTWNPGGYQNMSCCREDDLVVFGYLYINLYLVDPPKWRSYMLSDQLVFKQCMDMCDNGHPAWLAEPFRECFGPDGLARMTALDGDANAVELFKEHAKRLFRVMYRSSKYYHQKYQDPEMIAEHVAWIFLGGTRQPQRNYFS